MGLEVTYAVDAHGEPITTVVATGAYSARRLGEDLAHGRVEQANIGYMIQHVLAAYDALRTHRSADPATVEDLDPALRIYLQDLPSPGYLFRLAEAVLGAFEADYPLCLALDDVGPPGVRHLTGFGFSVPDEVRLRLAQVILYAAGHPHEAAEMRPVDVESSAPRAPRPGPSVPGLIRPTGPSETAMFHDGTLRQIVDVAVDGRV